MKGYGQAVIHLAWFRDYQIRHLLFGMVELRPIELTNVSSCLIKSTRYGSKGGKYIHYRRFAYTVDTAILWYEAALAGNTVLPVDPNHRTKGDGAELQAAEFVQEPSWPELVTSNDLAFAPDWMQGSRAHFLFQRKVLPSEIVEIINAEKTRQQLEEWLNFDIVSAYPEYQGAICLVAPNPLFRSIDKSHLEVAQPSFVESVAYKLVLRSGQSPDRLRLEVINERPRGRTTPFVKEFASDAIAVFDLPAELDKEGRSVTHPDHGLLSWSEPVSLLREIHVGVEVTSRRKTVHVPEGGRGRPEFFYDVNEVQDAGGFVTGDEARDKDIVSRLFEAEASRSRKNNAELYDQKLFYDAPSEAQHYVRQRIAGHEKTFDCRSIFCGTGTTGFRSCNSAA